MASNTLNIELLLKDNRFKTDIKALNVCFEGINKQLAVFTEGITSVCKQMQCVGTAVNAALGKGEANTSAAPAKADVAGTNSAKLSSQVAAQEETESAKRLAVVKTTETMLEANTQQTDNQNEAQEQQLSGWEIFLETVNSVSEKQTSNLAGRIQSIYTDFQNNLASSFQSLFEQIGNGWEGVKDIAVGFARSMYNSLTKILADMAAEQIKNIVAVKIAEITASKEKIAASAAEGGAKAAAGSAGWALFGAIAIGAAVMAGILALCGGFATGGIVGGNSFSGDRMLARVNSGEMILNSAQQARLFDMANGQEADSGSVGGAVVNQTINVSGTGDLSAITKAIKQGTADALEFANIAYKQGRKRNRYVA